MLTTHELLDPSRGPLRFFLVMITRLALLACVAKPKLWAATRSTPHDQYLANMKLLVSTAAASKLYKPRCIVLGMRRTRQLLHPDIKPISPYWTAMLDRARRDSAPCSFRGGPSLNTDRQIDRDMELWAPLSPIYV